MNKRKGKSFPDMRSSSRSRTSGRGTGRRVGERCDCCTWRMKTWTRLEDAWRRQREIRERTMRLKGMVQREIVPKVLDAVRGFVKDMAAGGPGGDAPASRRGGEKRRRRQGGGGGKGQRESERESAAKR